VFVTPPSWSHASGGRHVWARARTRARGAALIALAVLAASGCTTSARVRQTAATAIPTSATPSASASAIPSPTATRLPGTTQPGSPPPVVTHGPRTGNEVALTFDADMTPSMLAKLANGRAHSYANLKVIDILERQSIPATFFLTGMWVQRYPEVTQRLAGNPRFELANHTYDHRAYTSNCYSLGEVPRAEMAAEVSRTFDIIEPYGGRQTRYFRFPGGCYNAAALASLSSLGITVIQWDVVSGDPMATAWQPIVRAVLNHVQPGSIVVLHITEDNAPMTDEALPYILDGLRQKHLRPVTLSELLRQ
jgi:peptidoglycan/xylan/chitin deacetylase (PgdA/CDA1 family)